MNDNILVSIRISEELWKRFKIACIEQDTNASAQVEVLVKAWVESATK